MIRGPAHGHGPRAPHIQNPALLVWEPSVDILRTSQCNKSCFSLYSAQLTQYILSSTAKSSSSLLRFYQKRLSLSILCETFSTVLCTIYREWVQFIPETFNAWHHHRLLFMCKGIQSHIVKGYLCNVDSLSISAHHQYYAGLFKLTKKVSRLTTNQLIAINSSA